MRHKERLFRGEVPCTPCFQEGRKSNFHAQLYHREDGTFEALCFSHKQKREEQGEKFSWDNLALIEQCFHIPWGDVVKITLHKPDPTVYDRKGDVVTVQMRDVPNTELMRCHAIEVLHGLQLMADKNATIHQWTEGTEQNYCWTETSYFWESPVTGTVRDKYWGDERIKNFHKVCRFMSELHGWELVDETMDLLDRIVQAVDKEDS